MLNLTPEQVNAIYPIIGARLLRGGLVVQRLNLSPFTDTRRVSKPGKITHLSKRSRSNLLLTVSSFKEEFLSLMTLTYGCNYPLNGKTVKRHLNRFLTRLRQVYQDVRYVWFLEFQRRGAPHMHILTNLPGPTSEERLWFAGLWSGIACNGSNWLYTAVSYYHGRYRSDGELGTLDAVRWWHNRERAWEVIKKKDGAARYVCKYALKPYQKRVPIEYQDVGRFWGGSRCYSLNGGEVVYGSEAEIREFLWYKGRDFTNYEVLPKICVF